ncbi:class I SAM-dependent methyltransferase [Nocardioides sp. GCM10027113]|uniref:class I SAM-dependent methyltransferase n=1 Tax=unclassified Nocardioides TaxID=2615069 RepID=UPI003615F741
MSFDVAADAYTRFMGRFSEPLADVFLDWAGPPALGGTALDVGCGAGALTACLVDHLGAEAVAAVDPSGHFVAATSARCPGVDVRRGSAEALPFPDDSFDLVAAELVVHFMADPVAGLREMRRVARPGSVVAACVWDHGGDTGPLSLFWRVARQVVPSAPGEHELPGTREGHLAELFGAAGLAAVEAAPLTVTVAVAGAEAWWEPFTLGVGPAGAWVAGLDASTRDRLRVACLEALPRGPFEVTATAWSARGLA